MIDNTANISAIRYSVRLTSFILISQNIKERANRLARIATIVFQRKGWLNGIQLVFFPFSYVVIHRCPFVVNQFTQLHDVQLIQRFTLIESGLLTTFQGVPGLPRFPLHRTLARAALLHCSDVQSPQAFSLPPD